MNYYTKKRRERFAAAIKGCDPDLVAKVKTLDQEALCSAILLRSGLGPIEFAEEVLLCTPATFYRYRSMDRKMPALVTRFFRRELIRALHRQRHGAIPPESWCSSCGRGLEDGEGIIVYVPRAPDAVDELAESVGIEVGGNDLDELGEGTVADEDGGDAGTTTTLVDGGDQVVEISLG